MSLIVARLGDLGEFVRGITYKPSDVLTGTEANAIPCFRTKNIQEFLEVDDLVYIPSELVSPDKNVSAGDILVSSANSWNLVGKCCWVPELPYSASFGGFTSILRATSREVDPRYLYWWFSSPRVQATARSFGQQTTNISNLNHKRCLELEIPLPPLDEQKRIAAILDKADQLRQKRRQAIALFDSLTQSIFVEMFGDPVSNPRGFPIVELGSLITSGPTNGLYKPASAYGDGTRILRINNFYDGAIVGLDELRRLVISPKERDTYLLSENDIIINRVNSREYLGKSALVPPLDEAVVFESNMMRLSLDCDEIAPKYCIDFLQSQSIKQQIARKAKDAVNQSSINQSDVKSLRIMLPPIAKQREYAKVALANLTRRGIVDRAVAKGNQLFSSLQHRAFSGQL